MESYYSYQMNPNQEQNIKQEQTPGQEQNTQQTQDNAWSAQAQYTQYEKPPKKQRPPKKKTGFGEKLAKCVALALVFGLVAGTAFEGAGMFFTSVTGGTKSEAKTEASAPVLNKTAAAAEDAIQNPVRGDQVTSVTDVSGIVKNVMPSIVAITNMSETQYQNWFGQVQNYESESAGSGIIVSQDEENLYIATNNHVVADATSLTVQFSDDKTAGAEVKGTDPGNDLAVVAVKLSDIESDTLSSIKVATLGDSDAVKVGQPTIAIGNALGYGQSVTTGVVSALDREVSVTDEETGTTTTSELLQTDAAINPGNSGGALLNLAGEVIGINSVKYSDTTVEGMGYSIPINTASPIIEKLIKREAVSEGKTAYLGISGVDVSSSVAKTYNMSEGIYVYQVVSGSAAEKAGIAQGDIITEFDGTKIKTTADFEDQMQYYAAGQEVEVTIQRLSNEQNGQYQEQKLTVTLGRKNS